MKTMKNIFLFFGFVSVLSFMSCDTPVALGDKLDVLGPVVEIISPAPRKVVTGEFTIEGTARDNTSVEKILLRISQDRVDLPKQWCYENGKWKVSEDHGKSWVNYEGGVWKGNKRAGTFTLVINMEIGGEPPDDGEYLFILQAWDKGGFSDDNSIKMLVLIVDSNPPTVEIPNPYLWRLSDPDFQNLQGLSGDAWRVPEMIGKFQTRDFLVQWQLNDNHDLWSFDLRFYDYDVVIDGIPETELPSNYYYTYHQNVPPPTPEPDPLYYIRPNGSVLVPALEGEVKSYTDDQGVDRGEIARSVTGKTIIKVVAICYDAAGHPNEERTLGYFIYWPQADAPWITYTSGMDPLSKHNSGGSASIGDTVTSIKNDGFMIYPGRTISVNAFHYHGLKEVTYSLFLYNETNGAQTPVSGFSDITTMNTPRGDIYPTGFPWNFTPPIRPGIYIVRATPKALDDKPGDVYEAVFRVQDTTFPDFPDLPSPSASEPFFMSLNSDNTAFTLSGTVSDAAAVSSLCLVWINPQSREFASMAQLEYFRDHSYAGWRQAKTLTAGGAYAIEDEQFANKEGATGETYPFDTDHPNKLWRLSFSNPRVDPETQRTVYDYSRIITLADLNIGMSAQALKSQVFLLRADNPESRATVITYAPQGDTVVPAISIESVVVRRGAEIRSTVYPIGKPGYDPNVQILKFDVGDTIVVNGNWGDDTVRKLPAQTYLFPNMSFSINGEDFDSSGNGIIIERTPSTGTSPDGTGTFTITATVGAALPSTITLAKMKDTLVVGARVKDFGGNETEDTASWLVQTDELSLQRISSDAQDIAYKAGDTIEIFLEFNKPVMLKNRTTTPTLTLNTTGGTAGTAVFRTNPPQETEDTRQYFTYTVGAGQRTPNGSFLDVTGLSNAGDYTSGTYPFSWVHTPPASPTNEEIRILAPTATLPPVTIYTTANLPSGTAGANQVKSLLANKQIEIDTTAPTLTGISGTKGWHKQDAQIYITAEFSKNIKIDTTSNTTVPYLTFASQSMPNRTTSRNLNDVRVVNEKAITFVYTVQSGDGPSDMLIVENIVGTITDIPGTAFISANATPAQKTLDGVYIDTTAPSAPTVSIRTPSAPDTVITNTLGTNPAVSATSGGNAYAEGTQNPGTAPGTIVQLSTIYLDNLRLNIVPAGTSMERNYWKVEYSINYGNNWQTYSDEGVGGPINWGATDPDGTYQITARQIDKAGNVSPWSRPVVFNWDRGGPLVSNINSLTPNGTYTAYTDIDGEPKRGKIEITLNFRKQLAFSSAPSIRLNTNNGNASTTNITATTTANTLYSSLTFTYDVALNDSTNGDNLKVTSFVVPANSVFDGTPANTAVNVTSSFSMPTATDSKLEDVKAIKVEANALTADPPVFTGGTVNEDNTYSTMLNVTFNQNLIRGSGVMSIIQTAASFRLPTVLTETERNRYRTANNVMEELFDDFYTRGTNGLVGNVPDTSIKYILNYDVNPNQVTPNANGTDIQKLAEAFRQAEKLEFSATANVVSLNNNQLVVDISGTTALRVPGGLYEITIPAGFVRNELSRPSAQVPATLTAGGIARPFIRIKKAQETITGINNSTNNATLLTTPRIVAAQPITTTAKIDTRTPGTSIRYNFTPASTGVNDGTYWYSVPPAANNIPAAPNVSYNVGTPHTINTSINIGDNTYQGYIWRVTARAFAEGTLNAQTPNSEPSQDAAFRTVFTYQIVTMANPNNTSQQRARVGDQIWLRGGDAIGTSTVPGYPLTWVDDWQDLNTNKKRAGIRLMTLDPDTAPAASTDGTEISSATWKWVSWEITVDTYFDIILGRRESTDPQNDTELAQIKQYGPRQWAYQRAGWTSYKDDYRLIPGNHRWVTTAINANGLPAGANNKGAVNFSATFSVRPPALGATWTQP